MKPRHENRTLFANHTGYLLDSQVIHVWSISQVLFVHMVTNRWECGCVFWSEFASDAKEYHPCSSASYSPLYILFFRIQSFLSILVHAVKMIRFLRLHISLTLCLFKYLSKSDLVSSTAYPEFQNIFIELGLFLVYSARGVSRDIPLGLTTLKFAWFMSVFILNRSSRAWMFWLAIGSHHINS